MATKRIGEILSQMVALTSHDVEEILQEQAASKARKSFGDIALSMGLCRPEHVWRAWCGQLLEGPPRTIDLDRAGVDTQALSYISAELAHELNVVPVRVLGNVLIVAIPADSIGSAASNLPPRVKKDLRFAIASPEAIRRALTRYYPAVSVTA